MGQRALELPVGHLEARLEPALHEPRRQRELDAREEPVHEARAQARPGLAFLHSPQVAADALAQLRRGSRSRRRPARRRRRARAARGASRRPRGRRSCASRPAASPQPSSAGIATRTSRSSPACAPWSASSKPAGSIARPDLEARPLRGAAAEGTALHAPDVVGGHEVAVARSACPRARRRGARGARAAPRARGRSRPRRPRRRDACPSARRARGARSRGFTSTRAS